MAIFHFCTCRSTLLILCLIPALACVTERCETTEDCKNPELDEFCDKNFGACTSCSGYCTGAEDTIPLCMQNCPSKSAFGLWNRHRYVNSKQRIKGSLVNFICEAKSVSKWDAIIIVTCPSKVVQWTETMLFKLATIPYIHWVGDLLVYPKNQ